MATSQHQQPPIVLPGASWRIVGVSPTAQSQLFRAVASLHHTCSAPSRRLHTGFQAWLALERRYPTLLPCLQRIPSSGCKRIYLSLIGSIYSTGRGYLAAYLCRWSHSVVALLTSLQAEDDLPELTGLGSPTLGSRDLMAWVPQVTVSCEVQAPCWTSTVTWPALMD